MNKSHDAKSDPLQQCFLSQTGLQITNYQIPAGGMVFSKYLREKKKENSKYKSEPITLKRITLAKLCLQPCMTLPWLHPSKQTNCSDASSLCYNL